MNVVTLIGNLASDVELRDVGDDRQVANFLLAVNRPGKDEADFVRVSAWNKQAGACANYLAKGRKVGVDGRLRSSSWEDTDGNKRNAIEVVANRVEFLSPPPGKGGRRRHSIRGRSGLVLHKIVRWPTATRSSPSPTSCSSSTPTRTTGRWACRLRVPEKGLGSPVACRLRSSSSSAPRTRARRCSSFTTACSGTALQG